MNVLVLVVDDEPDVEALFRQHFRRDLRAQRFTMDFALSAQDALARIAGTIEQSLILILSDINMPGMSGLEMLPRGPGAAARRSRHHDHRLWRSRNQAEGDRRRRDRAADQADRFCVAAGGDRHPAGAGHKLKQDSQPGRWKRVQQHAPSCVTPEERRAATRFRCWRVGNRRCHRSHVSRRPGRRSRPLRNEERRICCTTSSCPGQ